MPSKKWRAENIDRMRQYRRTWYERNRATAIPLAAARRREYRERNRAIVWAAKDRPCTDCSRRYPYYVMHFDHLGDDKSGTINKMAWRPVSEDRLRTEIAKCEVVCANCHAERTHQRRTEAVAAVDPTQ